MLIRTRDTSHELVAAGVALALAATAWAVSVSGSSVGGHVHTGALFLAAWILMTVAMMFPTTLPMLTTYARLVRSNSKVLLFICGYLAAWTGCGLVALVADSLLHRVTDATGHTSLIGAGVLTLAAMYQFTPLKRHCLSKCRSALNFLMNAWRDGAVGAGLMGMHHGVFCVGCCWALMLVMLALGMSQLPWMLALTLLMFAEKVVRGGELIGRMIAPALFAGAVLMVGGSLA
jgi:predicted metal-binding membrane protein